MKFKLIQHQTPSKFRPKHNIFKSNYKKIKDELRINDWWMILDSDFINDYNNFTKILYAVLDNDTPLTNPPKKTTNIYMTNEAIRLKNKKARLWKRYIITKNQYDRGMYTRTNNELRRMTRD